ncbi:MAG: hypothetical protein KJ799_07400 [Bacteroidetes bacterium]|nr:hypothetical protein [Bacteroidota bacterium]
MNQKRLVLIMLLTLCNLSLAQKVDYNEILKSIKEVKSAYLNDNSMLLKMSNNEIKLVDLDSNEKENIDITGYIGRISQSKNDVYFITQTEGENNHNGILININGEQKTLPISTYNAKISENGKYIYTFQNDYFGGHFQLFETETLNELDLPIRNYSSFQAEFIDTNRMFFLYQMVKRNTDLDNYYKEQRHNSIQKQRNMEITKEEARTLLKVQRDERRKTTKYDVTTKYLIYNIQTQQIEFESNLEIGNDSYRFFTDMSSITISEDGGKVLVSAFSDINRLLLHNRLLEIDLTNNTISDISEKLGLKADDDIDEISYLNSNDYLVVGLNKGIAKFFLSNNSSIYKAEQKINGRWTRKGNKVTQRGNKIIIIDRFNKKFTWDYKNKNTLSVDSNSYPIFFTNGKLKETKEVLK